MISMVECVKKRKAGMRKKKLGWYKRGEIGIRRKVWDGWDKKGEE